MFILIAMLFYPGQLNTVTTLTIGKYTTLDNCKNAYYKIINDLCVNSDYGCTKPLDKSFGLTYSCVKDDE